MVKYLVEHALLLRLLLHLLLLHHVLHLRLREVDDLVLSLLLLALRRGGSRQHRGSAEDFTASRQQRISCFEQPRPRQKRTAARRALGQEHPHPGWNTSAVRAQTRRNPLPACPLTPFASSELQGKGTRIRSKPPSTAPPHAALRGHIASEGAVLRIW